MSGVPSPPRPGPLATLLLILGGLAIGFVSAMCGIGGGLFAVPLLHFGLGVELRRAVATGLFLVLSTAVAATATELVQPDSALHVGVVAALLVGALVGAQLGFHISKRLSRDLLRRVFVVVLAVAGARILFGGGGGGATGEVLDLSPLEIGGVFLIGLGGGTVAPILGIGGGLVFVPAMYLGLPELGFEGARACSLAAAVVAASRSLWLYLREGSAQVGFGVRLGLGALVGASMGVLLFHEPGWVGVARSALGLVLWFVAARFALDLVRAGRERRGGGA